MPVSTLTPLFTSFLPSLPFPAFKEFPTEVQSYPVLGFSDSNAARAALSKANPKIITASTDMVSGMETNERI